MGFSHAEVWSMGLGYFDQFFELSMNFSQLHQVSTKGLKCLQQLCIFSANGLEFIRVFRLGVTVSLG